VGIVATVSARIAALEGDIADLSQTTLRGWFTLILLATFAGETSADDVRAALADPDLDVIVREVTEQLPPEPEQPSGEEYVLAVRGPDRVGLLADVARICAEHSLNILDLSTRKSDGQYLTLLQLDAHAARPLDQVRAALEAAGAARGFAYTLQHDDVFRATHEIGA
jgi:glycine cleavage system transcriptional repressor